MSNFYTGVGSRKTPDNVLTLMRLIALRMNAYGYTLRSGGAVGADSAFESGAGNNKEIYYANDSTLASEQIASQFHPAWNRCSAYARKLHGRNSFQILGRDLNLPSDYCICWTPDGCESHATRVRSTGGTGTAISIADYYNVPIINLANPVQFNRWLKWLEE